MQPYLSFFISAKKQKSNKPGFAATVVRLVFFLSLFAPAYGYGQKVTLSVKAVSLDKVFKEIKSQTGYVFFYDEAWMKEAKKVSIDVVNASLEDALKACFKNQPFSYSVVGTTVTIKQKLISVPPKGIEEEPPAMTPFAVKGKIVDDEGNPLDVASVKIMGSDKGGATDKNGNFSLEIPAAGATLLFSYVGFEPVEMRVSGPQDLNISFKRLVNKVDEIVVVGYGTQRKRDVTGSIVSVSKERMENLPNTNFQQALQGAVPGIRVTTNSNGSEGNGSSILVRGRNSISAGTSPLIILDGIPYTGGMSEINPVDLESIDVLKDASSAAIYGAKAAGGVILLTTKQGKRGKATVNYDGQFGIQQIANKPDLLRGDEFYAFKKARLNVLGAMTPSEEAVFAAKSWVDWYDLATRDGGRNQQSISIAGAAEKSKYFFNATYLNVKGIALNDDFKRYSIRSNVEYKLTNWITLGSNTMITVLDRGGMPADFAGQNGANFMNPLTTPFEADGVTPKVYAWPENNVNGNPLSNLVVKNNDKTYRIISANNVKVDIPFIKGLYYKLNTGVELDNTIRKTYYGRGTRTGFENGGQATNFNSIQRNFTIENILNYSKEIGDHNIGATALYSFQSEDGDRDQFTGIGFGSDLLTNYQMNQATLLSSSSSTSGTTYKRNTISQMLRVNYGYASKYLLTVTARRDGFSSFGANSKFGVFPAVAVGWNVFRERFMQNVNQVSALKLRASYGLNGNSNVPAYSSLANFRTRNYVSGLGTSSNPVVVLPGNIPSTLANDILGWESSKVLNLGLDFGILKDRISGTVEYYDKTSKDLILRRAISPVQGFSSIIQNIGKVSNTGVEVALNTINVSKKNFTWNTNANISFNTNKILDLYGDGKDDIGNQWFLGKPINMNYGYQYDGVYQTGEDLSLQPGAQPGYVKIKDINGDKLININDRTLIGSADPNILWGMSNTFKYKNFTFNIFIHGVGDITKENPLVQDAVFSAVSRNTTRKDWWSPTNPSKSHWANDANANRLGVNVYEDASFVRLKDITIAYDLPTKLLKKWKIEKLKFYITARNLATFTKYTGLDPEISNQLDIPLQREINFGINLGL